MHSESVRLRPIAPLATEGHSKMTGLPRSAKTAMLVIYAADEGHASCPRCRAGMFSDTGESNSLLVRMEIPRQYTQQYQCKLCERG
jgi:hypothetical protein